LRTGTVRGNRCLASVLRARDSRSTATGSRTGTQMARQRRGERRVSLRSGYNARSRSSTTGKERPLWRRNPHWPLNGMISVEAKPPGKRRPALPTGLWHSPTEIRGRRATHQRFCLASSQTKPAQPGRSRTDHGEGKVEVHKLLRVGEWADPTQALEVIGKSMPSKEDCLHSHRNDDPTPTRRRVSRKLDVPVEVLARERCFPRLLDE